MTNGILGPVRALHDVNGGDVAGRPAKGVKRARGSVWIFRRKIAADLADGAGELTNKTDQQRREQGPVSAQTPRDWRMSIPGTSTSNSSPRSGGTNGFDAAPFDSGT